MENLDQDLAIAEKIEDDTHACNTELSDVTGSLEALTGALQGTGPVELSEKQQAAVTAFNNLKKNQKQAVYGVVDEAALESFVGSTLNIAKKAADYTSRGIAVKFNQTSNALNHYAQMAAKLKARLEQLKPLLKKRQFPLVDVFDYGSYSRFFQVGGKSIGLYSQFEEAVLTQGRVTNYAFTAIESYGSVITRKLLTSLQKLHATKTPDATEIIELRDSIERYWLQTWKEADLAAARGQVPQEALNGHPEAKFVSVAALLDNRYLVAYQPKNNGGGDTAKTVNAIKNYGASIAFDKTKVDKAQQSMNIPNCDQLLELVDDVLIQLNDFKSVIPLAKENAKLSKELQRALDIVLKQVNTEKDPQYFGFLFEYFKLLNASAIAAQEPYVAIAWLYIRVALVVVTLVELSVLEEPSDRIVTKKFVTKQNEEFSNIATESYIGTQNVLNAFRDEIYKQK